MTVIVAVSDGKRVCMAADSQATNGKGHFGHVKRAKIVRRETSIGPMLLGVSGNMSVLDWVRWAVIEDPTNLELPSDAGGKTLAEWASRCLGPRFREWGASTKIAENEKGANWIDGEILCASGAEWCAVNGEGGVVELEALFHAIGSGADAARGAMWVSVRSERYKASSPAGYSFAEGIGRTGVGAAIALDIGCGGPVVVEWTDL